MISKAFRTGFSLGFPGSITGGRATNIPPHPHYCTFCWKHCTMITGPASPPCRWPLWAIHCRLRDSLDQQFPFLYLYPAVTRPTPCGSLQWRLSQGTNKLVGLLQYGDTGFFFCLSDARATDGLSSFIRVQNGTECLCVEIV